MFKFIDLFTNIESTASKLGMDIESAFKFTAHLVVAATPALTTAADVAEAVSGNAALIPVTNEVSATVLTTSEAVTTGDVIQNAGTVAEVIEKATGNTQDIALTSAAVNILHPDQSITGVAHVTTG